MKKILVVDDDPELLQYITTTLIRGGMPAVGAHSGDEAIKILRHKSRDFRLLLTDIVMPRITGIDLAAMVADTDPGMPIVFMTGYKTDHLEQFGESLDGRDVLGKPFTPSELLAIVKVALKNFEKVKTV